MKKTSALTVYSQTGQSSNQIVIHPNDGFDLGLMSLNYPADIYSKISVDDFQKGSSQAVTGSIRLENNCRPGTIELGVKYWKELGKPETVILYYDEGKLLVS